MKRWKAILGDLVDLLIPPACLVCGTRIENQDQVLCSDCEANIRLLSGNRCSTCGELLTTSECPNCHGEAYAFDKVESMFSYSGSVRDLVHRLKYDGYTSPAGYFAAELSELIQSDAGLQSCDLLCSVPLHRVRKRERGYNQSELIAYATASLAGKPYAEPVTRRFYTRSQTRLSRAGRKKNLHNAFTVSNPDLVKDKQVILVDDVFTTGSTLNEVAKELKKAGANKVMAITVARA